MRDQCHHTVRVRATPSRQHNRLGPMAFLAEERSFQTEKCYEEGGTDGLTCLSRGARTFRLVWNFSCPYDNSPWARPSRTSSCSGVGHCLEHPTLLYKIEASSTVTSALFHINMDSLFASYGDDSDSSGSDEEKQQKVYEKHLSMRRRNKKKISCMKNYVTNTIRYERKK